MLKLSISAGQERENATLIQNQTDMLSSRNYIVSESTDHTPTMHRQCVNPHKVVLEPRESRWWEIRVAGLFHKPGV